MLFQILDEKRNCPLVYHSNRLTNKPLPKSKEELRTWSYGDFIGDKPVQYAQFYCGGRTIDEICPDLMLDEWQAVRKKLKAFYRSVREAKLNLDEHCFYDMVPEQFLLDYCAIKNKITQYIFNVYEKPANYDFLVNLKKISYEISKRKLDLDLSTLTPRMHEYRVRQFAKKVKKSNPQIQYNIFGSKTGRLTTLKGSFPILTMDKSFRKIIKPKNDWFVEFDFNAAELRVLLGLLGKEQPQEDIHTWNAKNVYHDSVTREEAKKRIFAWLYNPESQDKLSSKSYDRGLILKSHWDGDKVHTIYNRTIEADEYHALNYTIQSTAADLFCTQMLKVWEKIKTSNSHIAFCIHDSLIIDFSEKDMNILLDLKRTFSETDLGNFMVGVKVGKSFGEMKEL